MAETVEAILRRVIDPHSMVDIPALSDKIAALSSIRADRFYVMGPYENNDSYSICRDDPSGGDPLTIVTIAKIHRPDELHSLCRLASKQFDKASHADHSFHFDPTNDPCPYCDTQMAGELNCPNCIREHPDRGIPASVGTPTVEK